MCAVLRKWKYFDWIFFKLCQMAPCHTLIYLLLPAWKTDLFKIPLFIFFLQDRILPVVLWSGFQFR